MKDKTTDAAIAGRKRIRGARNREGSSAAPALPPVDTKEEELADERQWQEQFAVSGDILTQLAAEAREERRQGKTLPLETILVD